MLLDKVEMNVDVLSARVELGFAGKGDSHLIVAIDGGGGKGNIMVH